jgi:hypothetical protein
LKFQGTQIFFAFDLLKLPFSNYLCVSKSKNMFEFDQYLGFLAFFTVITIGFWLMMLLLLFIVPYWLGGNLMEIWKERREAKRAQQSE